MLVDTDVIRPNPLAALDAIIGSITAAPRNPVSMEHVQITNQSVASSRGKTRMALDGFNDEGESLRLSLAAIGLGRKGGKVCAPPGSVY